ncbi:MAG TPA: adenine phosphoribosyltransferase [Longimicrobiales bacterium]|nr:adenine phosphoribosyltransferase [Longimicrobiales bacterium]
MHPVAIAQQVRALVRDVADFPRSGIVFKDITPILADPRLLRAAVDGMARPFAGQGIETVAGIESRGFIFGAAVALELGAGFVPVRKPGKLPHDCRRIDYQLEYGTDSLEAHTDALAGGRRVLIVDDVLATGGTAAAAADLMRQLGGDVAGATFLLELTFLSGRIRLPGLTVRSLVDF